MFSGLAILFLSTGFNLLGDALRDMLDPRLRAGPQTSVTAGDAKTPALVKAMHEDHNSVECPANALCRHPDLRIILDSVATKRLTAQALNGLEPTFTPPTGIEQ